MVTTAATTTAMTAAAAAAAATTTVIVAPATLLLGRGSGEGAGGRPGSLRVEWMLHIDGDLPANEALNVTKEVALLCAQGQRPSNNKKRKFAPLLRRTKWSLRLHPRGLCVQCGARRSRAVPSQVSNTNMPQ
jgi:hypothetical protein